jgi:integrase
MVGSSTRPQPLSSAGALWSSITCGGIIPVSCATRTWSGVIAPHESSDASRRNFGQDRPQLDDVLTPLLHDLTSARTVPLRSLYATVRAIKLPQTRHNSRQGQHARSVENGTVQIAGAQSPLRVVGEPARPPRRQRNSERRPREYLTPAEVERLMATAKKRGRYGHRDAMMILIAYRHGLRVGELVRLLWDQIDFPQGFCMSLA